MSFSVDIQSSSLLLLLFLVVGACVTPTTKAIQRGNLGSSLKRKTGEASIQTLQGHINSQLSYTHLCVCRVYTCTCISYQFPIILLFRLLMSEAFHIDKYS